MGPGRKRKHEDPVAEAEKQGGRDGGGQSDQPNSYSEGGKPSVTMKMEVSMIKIIKLGQGT